LCILFVEIYIAKGHLNKKLELPLDGIIYHIWSISENVQERSSIIRVLTSKKPRKGRQYASHVSSGLVTA
jgi:hypothetical protein